MRRRVLTRGSQGGKGGGHKAATHAPATRDRGGKPADSVAADAPLHGGGAVLSPSRARAQAQAAPRVERRLDFAAVADDAEREAEPVARAPIELLRPKPPQLLSCTELGRLLGTLLKNKFV